MGMGEEYVRAAPFMELQRRQRATAFQADGTRQWAGTAFRRTRCHMAVASTTALIAVGSSATVTTPWQGDGFLDDDGVTVLDYGVEILPTGLLGKGTVSNIILTGVDTTVTVTAGLLIAIGTQFIIHGCSRLPSP